MRTLKIPHTLQLETTIDLDKMDKELVPAILSMTLEQQQDMLISMAKSILQTNSVDKANEGNSWAVLEIK